MTKLPVLSDNKEEVLMELQEIGVRPVVKRYCHTCNNRTSNSDSEWYRCNIFHGKLCSKVNPNNNCIHWVERSKSNEETRLSLDIVIVICVLSGLFGLLTGLLF